MSLDGMRNALVDALSGISGLAATTRFSQPAVPTAFVGLPTRILYDEDLDGAATYTIPVKVFVRNDTNGHDLLAECMETSGARSVKQALQSDPSLSGNCDSLRVVEMTSSAPEFEALQATYLTADFFLEIYA